MSPVRSPSPGFWSWFRILKFRAAVPNLLQGSCIACRQRGIKELKDKGFLRGIHFASNALADDRPNHLSRKQKRLCWSWQEDAFHKSVVLGLAMHFLSRCNQPWHSYLYHTRLSGNVPQCMDAICVQAMVRLIMSGSRPFSCGFACVPIR